MPYMLPSIAATYANVAAPSFWDESASGVVAASTVFSNADLAACKAAITRPLSAEWTGEWYGAGGGNSQIFDGSVLLIPKGGVISLNELYIHHQLFEPDGGGGVVLFDAGGARIQFSSGYSRPFGVTDMGEAEYIDDITIPGMGTTVGLLTFATPFLCTGIMVSGYSNGNRAALVLGVYTPDMGPRAAFWEAFVKSREFVRA